MQRRFTMRRPLRSRIFEDAPALRNGVVLGGMLGALTACAPRSITPASDVASKIAPAVSVAAAAVESPAPSLAEGVPDVEMVQAWQGFGVPKCSYLAPKQDFIGEDGGVDIVFHFHAGQMSEREMRASGVRGVFVSCGYGIGTTPYARTFDAPTRFGWMMKRLFAAIAAGAKRQDVHLRHLALASWSAGFAAVGRILAVPEWYAAADTVVLLDSLHARYVDADGEKGPARGADRVNVQMLRHFIRFAADAAAGKKTMVITHSSIVPPDYASTTEATTALLAEIGVAAVDTHEPAYRGMTLWAKADEGDLHVRGFRGQGPRDHFDHLHLIGEALRSWLVPHWYAPPAEQR